MTPSPEQRLPRELLKELIEEGSDAFRGVLEKLLNTAMQMEREEFLGARRWERSEQRRDHANGYKAKKLSTRVGQLQIRIPQVRHLDFYPRSLERGCRSEKALKLAIAEMYVMGVSTRKVTEITEQLCGTEISASQVSRISKLLDDELEQFRNRPLGSYPVVYLDAHYEKVRRQGSIQDVAVLKATGVNCWGKREVIGVSCRLSEAEVHWREFLQQLQKRGLEGVQLIVSDDHSGLRAARRAVFPSVPWQRCQFHLSQNAQRYARRSDQRAAIATDIRDIFNAPSGGEAEAMLRARVEQYYDRNPELADWMETNLPEGFTVFRFARSTWRRIRTNNGLENLNRQIRRRTRVVGIFPNTESALRLITAVVEEIHEDWLIGKQYLSLVDFKPQENPISDHSQSNYRKTCLYCKRRIECSGSVQALASRNVSHEVSGNRRTKLEEPAPYALVGNIQTSLRKKILHIPIAQSEPGIEPNGASNDFRWKAVTFEGDGVHPKRLHRNHQIEIRALNVTMPSGQVTLADSSLRIGLRI